MKTIDLKSLLLGAALSAIVFATIAATSSTSGISDYTIVSAKLPSKCSRQVVDLIKQGWKPVDGVAVSLSTHGTIYAQALVKSE